MNRLRSFLKSPRIESSPPQGTNAENFIAPSSIFNHVGGHQYNTNITHIYPAPPALVTSPSSAPSPHQASFNDAPIDNLSIHFTGRKRELALIAEAFEKRRNIPTRCVLFGNQGVGKSQLAYAWANSTFSRGENSYILWISATTVEKLYQGFCRLLQFVDHQDRSHPDQSVRLAAARRWLEDVTTGNWLLVLDNVFPETMDFLRQHLPRQNGRGTILFTTRTERVALAVANTAGERHSVIEVPLLDIKAGVELFCGHFDSEKMEPSSTKVETIVKAVGCLPLAISHAAGYMKESQSSLDDMLELYQSKHRIDVINWEHTLSEYEHKSVAATFTSQLQDLDEHCPDASRLLRVLTFFDHESIPVEMLITGANVIVESQPQSQSLLTEPLLALIQSPIARRNAIADLQARCLVTYHNTSQSPTFRIHDLIQLVVLENTRNSGLDQELFEFAVQLACAAFSKIENISSSESWPQCELLVPHIQSLTLRQDTSSKAKKALLPVNFSRGLYLHNRGRYVEAEALYESVVADREGLFGHDDLDTLAVMQDLAYVYCRRGRYVEAETLFGRVLASRKTHLGPEHRDTLHTMFYLAHFYFDQDRFNEAETLLEQILQIQESQYDSEDDNVLSLLAEVYGHKGRYNEAESLLTRILQRRESLLGSEHYNTLAARHSLGNVYLLRGQYDAAAALLPPVLRALERDLGSQHPNTLIASFTLARVYTSQGCYKDAESLLVPVSAARERILGLSHPHTQNAITALARVYEKLGRFDEARLLEQRISSSSS